MSDQARRIPRRRWGIGVLLGAGVLVNYFDRINLSVSGPQLQQEFGLTTADMGLLFSAFFWSYALLQVPTGLVLDRFGVTLVGRIGSFLWAAATLLITVASGFGGVLAARVVLGVAEAPAFPPTRRRPAIGSRARSGPCQPRSSTPPRNSRTSSGCRSSPWSA